MCTGHSLGCGFPSNRAPLGEWPFGESVDIYSPSLGVVSRFLFCSVSIYISRFLRLQPDLYAARPLRRQGSRHLRHRPQQVARALRRPATASRLSGDAAQRRAAARLPRAASDPRRPAHPLTRPKRTPLMATNAAIPKIPCTKTLRRRGSATVAVWGEEKDQPQLNATSQNQSCLSVVPTPRSCTLKTVLACRPYVPC